MKDDVSIVYMLTDMLLLKLIETLVLKLLYIYDDVEINVDYLSVLGDDEEVD